MHPVIAWMIGASYISYRYGYQCRMLPKPHRFIGLTALISFAAILGSFNANAGAALAYGSIISMFVYGESHKTNIVCDQINPTNIATGQKKEQQKSTAQKAVGIAGVLAPFFPGVGEITKAQNAVGG